MLATFGCSCWGDFLGIASLATTDTSVLRRAKVGDRRKQRVNVRRKGLRGTLDTVRYVGSQFFLPSGRGIFRSAISIAPANVTFT